MSLFINFIKSDKFSFSYWNEDNISILNIMINSNKDFENSISFESFIFYLKTIKFDKARVSWLGIVPDILLSEFIETLNIVDRPSAVKTTSESETNYPTIFNPFGVSSPILPISSSSSSNQKDIKQSNTFKIDVSTLKKHIQTYPAHPNLLDSSAKNMPKIINYIKATLGKNMTREYLDALCTELIKFANENMNNL